MTKEKYASVRPTKELIALFELINNVEVAQDNDRQAVFERAMKYVAESGISVLKIAEKSRVEETDIDEVPSSLKVRVDETLFKQLIEMFREAFQIERVKIPYLMRITLTAYLLHIQQKYKNTIINEINPLIEFGIDPLVFKQEYEHSDEPNKVELYKVSREYLENVNLELNRHLREQVNKQIQGFSDYYNIGKYYPKRGATFAKTNIIFISKVFAGLVLFQCDMNGYDLSEVIKNFKGATNKGNK